VAKSSNKEPTLSSHLLSQEHPKMKEHSHLQAKELDDIQPLLLYISTPEMTEVSLHEELQHKPSQGHFCHHMKFSIGRSRIHRTFASSRCKHLDHAMCHSLRSFSARPDLVSARRASGHGFVAQPCNARFCGEPPQTPQTRCSVYAKIL
jgi:hypothetical protein